MTTTRPAPVRETGRTGHAFGRRPGGPGDGAEHRPVRRGRRARRLLLALVSFVLVVGLLAIGGAGWYFSGLIGTDGMGINPSVPNYTLEVVSADGSTVTLSDPEEEHPVLRTDFVYGIHYRPADAPDAAASDGFAQLVGPGDEGAEVTRQITVVSGRAPVVGDTVAMWRSAFPEDPQAIGLEVEEVLVADEYPAWFAPGEGDTWAILIHGKGGTRGEMLRLMRTTVDAGLPSLAVTYRNDPGVTQEEDGLYRFGATEWEDLAAAVTYAQDNGAQDVVVLAVSMGAAITARYLEQVPEAPVSALVLDAPMLDFGAAVSHGASQRTLPVVGQVPEAVTWTAKRFASLRYDVDWGEINYLDDTSWLSVPTLAFHGTGDKTVPVTVTRQLAEAHPDLVDYVEVEGAGHVEVWNADPAAFDAAVEDFLSQR